MSIVESLLSLALEHARQAGANRILRINLVVGEYSGVVDESVEFYFRFLSKDTIAAGASINFKHTKAQLRCRKCDIIFSAEGTEFRCPNCKEQQIEITGGRELYLESLEVE